MTELERLKEQFFQILLDRLDDFDQRLLCDYGDDSYWSPKDFVYCLTPDEYIFLKRHKNEKTNKR